MNFGNVISNPTHVESSIAASILLKASLDGDYVIGKYGDGYSTVRIPLVAGEWRRIVIYQSSLPAGKEFTLVGWPDDAGGPAVSFTALQVLIEPRIHFQRTGFWEKCWVVGQ